MNLDVTSTARSKVGLAWSVLRAITHAAVFGQEHVAAPDPSAIFEQARITGERVLFSDGFEGPTETRFIQFYGGDAPNKVVFSGPTDEQARAGKCSYKIAVRIEPVEKPTTVTFYVDEVTITGRLPTNWKDQQS